jgi:hypothetical protein
VAALALLFSIHRYVLDVEIIWEKRILFIYLFILYFYLFIYLFIYVCIYLFI